MSIHRKTAICVLVICILPATAHAVGYQAVSQREADPGPLVREGVKPSPLNKAVYAFVEVPAAIIDGLAVAFDAILSQFDIGSYRPPTYDSPSIRADETM